MRKIIFQEEVEESLSNQEFQTKKEKKATISRNVTRKPRLKRKRKEKKPEEKEKEVFYRGEMQEQMWQSEEIDDPFNCLAYSESEDFLKFPSNEVVFQNLELKERMHHLSDKFLESTGTKKMSIYVQAKLLLAGGYVSPTKVKKEKGGKTKGEDNNNIFLSLKELAPIVKKIIQRRQMGYFEDILWSLLAEPEVQRKIVPGIHPDSWVEHMKRRTYDVFSVFDGAKIIREDQKDTRIWYLN